ncbi:SU10 major capsid protein [Victivallis vadensis]|uniref:SU10 major capsid protein n=1 Tax=Victivallis vadensis TaxID=172901 RepID=UPI003AF7ABA4
MPEPIRTYSLTNKARDLSSVMHTVVEKYGGFLALFKPAARATAQKHEWHQDKIAGRAFVVTAYSAGTGATVSADDYAKLRVGTRFKVKGYPVIFKVTSLEGSNKFKIAVHAENGNTAKTAPAANDVCQIVGTPTKPGSKLGEGDDTHRTVGTDYNFCQIIRKDTGLTNSDLAVTTTDQVENSIARQTEHAIDEARRDLSRAAIWGTRTERDDSNGIPGEAGGLYAFALGGIEVDAGGKRISTKLINDAALKITEEGGNPTAVCCSPANARVLGNEYKDKLTVMQDDKTRGVYVAMVVNEANGKGIKIVGDADFDDCDAFVVDEECFGISYLRPLYDEDSTTKGTDGISRMVMTEFTFEFHNSKQRLARIKNLQDPQVALDEITEEAKAVNVTASTMSISASTVNVTQTPAQG